MPQWNLIQVMNKFNVSGDALSKQMKRSPPSISGYRRKAPAEMIQKRIAEALSVLTGNKIARLDLWAWDEEELPEPKDIFRLKNDSN